MKALDHKHIVKMVGVCLEDPVMILLEYMANGDLKAYLTDHTVS